MDRVGAAELQMLDALEMVVGGDGESLLRLFLTDDELVELVNDRSRGDAKKAIDVALFFHSRRV